MPGTPSAAALRCAAPVSDARYTIDERGLDCAPIRGEDPAPIDTHSRALKQQLGLLRVHDGRAIVAMG